MGMMGFLRGNFTCREGGVRLWVRVWSGECVLVDFNKTVSKSTRKSMYPGLQELKGDQNSWIVAHVYDRDEEVQGIGWNKR